MTGSIRFEDFAAGLYERGASHPGGDQHAARIERIVRLRILRDRLYERAADLSTPAPHARIAYRMARGCVRGMDRLLAEEGA